MNSLMKKHVLVILPVIFMFACNSSKETSKVKPEFNNFRDSVSYVIGADIGKNFKTNGIDVDLDLMILGLQDAISENDTLFSATEVQAIITKFQQELQKSQAERSAQESGENIEKGKVFLMENKSKDGVMTTESGLQYKVLRESDGAKPTALNTVKVNYEGKLIDGTIFDSSYERGEPISFRLDQVIKGWTEGLQLMSVGSMYELYIPSELGYGDRSIPGIPAGSVLVFKVELLGIE